ncbi:IclR family transcriptional regulator [Fodinicola acaciae]|uniref:IclR family transcriptional regulator n=1 Tax=Fodinicola acaciae TaxID=2681555 RepID=UPI0013D11049|nr:IclR family transcriptional regulator [Fodinicola acaciae]
MPARTTEPASVSARLIAILDTFSEASPVRTLSDISRHSGLPLTTTHRLVAELAAGGLLERDPDGRYRIGLRLWEIASLAPHGMRLRQTAIPYLEDLYEVTHHHVQLAVVDGHDVVYLERISSRNAVHVVSRVGGRLPVHATGVGQVLLAHASPDLQEQVLAKPLRRYTSKTLCTEPELRRTLADIRLRGFAISDGAIELAALSVAAPVFGRDDRVVAAVSVVVPAQTDPYALAPAVVATARAISRALGAPRGQRLPGPVRRETHGVY